MAIGEFVLDFFFGPCLDNSAVDERQNQPQHSQYQRQHQPRQHPQRPPSPSPQRRSVSGRRSEGGRGSSRKRLIAIPENEQQQQQLMLIGNGNGNNHNNLRTRKRSVSREGSSNGLRSNGTDGGHQPRTHARRYKQRANGDLSTLTDSQNNGKHRYRRDDVSVMSASLGETYKGYMAGDDEDLAEQTAIRRSIKDAEKTRRKNVLKERSRSAPPPASQKTDLESWMDRSRDDSMDTDYDNVTTISKASKNPYRVLGISQSASPREIYGSYKRRMREAERGGGSDKAFRDVGNAYRRIKADIKRQEARKERRRTQQQQRGGDRSKKKGDDKRNNKQQGRSSSSDEESDAKSRRESVDARLKDHSELVQGLFAKDNSGKKKRGISSNGSVSSRGQVTTLQNSIQSQSQALSELNIVPVEAGASNINEQKKRIQNSCFYLSLAASYLSGVGAFAEDPTASYYLSTLNQSGSASVATVELEIAALPQREKQLTMSLALQLKRAIEAAVLLVHPDWAESGMVGESVQAFSDFLVYALDSDSVLGHWAIAVFDEASGFVDVYRGRHYGKVYPPTKLKQKRSSGGSRRDLTDKVKWKYKPCDEDARRASTLTLRYVPGHYQPLLPELTKMKNTARSRREDADLNPRPALEHVLATLEKWNVLHVVTDGRA
mmetsp:Transcript_43785/g.93093  ORF Transcript_43785/g.93093 Transcript_43785/m.93093 type:complete len:663 (-) Transcript_43785:70-2058(-)